MTIQEIKQLVEDYPNDQDLGGKVRELYWRDYKNGTYSFISNQLKKIIYPKGVFVLKYNQEPVDNKFIASIISFIYLYLVIFFIITALLSLTGLDFITSVSGAA